MAEKRKALTLDELIDALVEIRLKSPLKGKTVSHICIPDHEYQPIHEVKLTDTDAGNEDNPSGVVLLFSDSLDKIIDDLNMEALLGDHSLVGAVHHGALDDLEEFNPIDSVDWENTTEFDEIPSPEE